MEPILLLVTYQAKPQEGKHFVEEVRASGILDEIYKEEGFLSYRYYYDAADPDRILLVEEWASREHQQKHLQTPHMMQLKTIKEKYIDDIQVKIMVP